MLHRYELFTKTHCPKCPIVKKYLEENHSSCGEFLNVDEGDNLQRAADLQLTAVPTVVCYDIDDNVIATLSELSEIKEFFNKSE